MALSRQTRIGIYLALVTLFVTFGVYIYQILFSPNMLVRQEDKWLYIPTGAKFPQVIDSLKRNNIVDDAMTFAALARFTKYRDNVKPGAYLIPQNSTNLQIIRMLQNGRQKPVKVVWNSVRTKADLARKLDARLELDSATILARLMDADTCAAYGFKPETIVAMFIPNTYEMYWNVSATGLWKKMRKEYSTFWTQDRLAMAKALDMTPEQVVTLASIVQWETAKPDEMPDVAGVYINRLRADMALQADPTVIYALGDFTIKRVLRGHTLTDSPYNTYKHKGLPPGPIDLPSATAIDATLYYHKHDYIFFVAKADFSGYHTFAKTYPEHLKYAAEYTKALDKLLAGKAAAVAPGNGPLPVVK
jgi:UPF0755 protein